LSSLQLASLPAAAEYLPLALDIMKEPEGYVTEPNNMKWDQEGLVGINWTSRLKAPRGRLSSASIQ
jgi:hypothetical protein